MNRPMEDVAAVRESWLNTIEKQLAEQQQMVRSDRERLKLIIDRLIGAEPETIDKAVTVDEAPTHCARDSINRQVEWLHDDIRFLHQQINRLEENGIV